MIHRLIIFIICAFVISSNSFVVYQEGYDTTQIEKAVYQPISKQIRDIEGYIEKTAENRGLDVDLLLDLSHWESQYKSNAQNPNTSAGGVFQITDATWKDNCEGKKYNARDNINCAMDMISDGELWRWHIDKNICRKMVRNDYLNSRQDCRYCDLNDDSFCYE